MVNPQALSSLRKAAIIHVTDKRKAQAVKWMANDKAEAEILVLHPDGTTSVELFEDWVPDIVAQRHGDLETANDQLREILNENFYKV